jgi:hypothetical protein
VDGIQTIIARSTLPKLLRVMQGLRCRDDNSLNQVQNVDGDSWATIFAYGPGQLHVHNPQALP